MTIKQVLMGRGIYSVELELELLRAISGEKQEYYERVPPRFEVSPTIDPFPFRAPFEITCDLSAI